MKLDTGFLCTDSRGNRILLYRFADRVSGSYTEASKENYQIQTGDETEMRLIDADALKAKIMMDVPGYLDGGSSITKAFIMAMVGTRSVCPTIDAVPVVRCRDCKAWKQYDDMNLGACELYPEYNKKGDWFCNFGERKEGR